MLDKIKLFYPPLDQKIKARIIELNKTGLGRVKIKHQLKNESVRVSDATISNVIRDYKIKSNEAIQSTAATPQVKPFIVPGGGTKPQQQEDQIKLQTLLSQQQELELLRQHLDQRQQQQQITDYDNLSVC